MNNDKETQAMNEVIIQRQAEEKKRLDDAIAARQRKQEALDRDNKLVAESEKAFAEQRKKQLIDSLFYGLSQETSKDLEKLIDLSNQLIYVDNQYDPNHKKRISILAQMDVLRNKITSAGRNLGDHTFIKKVYYQSANKDYFLFPNDQGVYHIFAGTLGSFRTTDRSLQTDENGNPVKIFKQDRIQTSPEIPIMDFETVVIKDKPDTPVIRTKPHKPLFKTQNVLENDDLSKNPQDKKRDNKRNWISGRSE